MCTAYTHYPYVCYSCSEHALVSAADPTQMTSLQTLHHRHISCWLVFSIHGCFLFYSPYCLCFTLLYLYVCIHISGRILRLNNSKSLPLVLVHWIRSSSLPTCVHAYVCVCFIWGKVHPLSQNHINGFRQAVLCLCSNCFSAQLPDRTDALHAAAWERRAACHFLRFNPDNGTRFLCKGRNHCLFRLG